MTLTFQIALILLALLVIGNVFTAIIQDLFIFRPSKLKREYVYHFDLPFEEHYVDSIEGGEINLLWFKKDGIKRPLVFYCHGNSSNLSSWGELAQRYEKLGFDLIMYDYRGFGKSKGRRNEMTFREDARVVYQFAKRYYSESHIYIYGRSMGTGVATMLASENDPVLLLLETPYYSMRELFRSYYPFLPVLLFSFKYNFPTNEWITKVNCPVYIFQGTKDTVVPFRCAEKLKPLLKEPDNFVTIRGGKHSNLKEFPEFTDNIKSIFRKYHPFIDQA